MDCSTVVNIILSILSFLLATISVVTVVITLKQNNRMIENATRPYVCVYGECINTGIPMFYIVLKNFGASPAIMTKFDSSFDFKECYKFNSPKNYIEEFSSTILAPGQSRICLLDYEKIPDEITFSLEYSCEGKVYSDTFKADIKSGTEAPSSKNATKDTELRSISYTLQEMLQKSL